MKYLIMLLTAGVLSAQYIPITPKEKLEIKQYEIDIQKIWDKNYSCRKFSKSKSERRNCTIKYNQDLEKIKIEYKDYIVKFTKPRYERKNKD